MANANDGESGGFSAWKYKHYFEFLQMKDNKNMTVKCKLCVGQKSLSTSTRSNANLLKHLQSVHGATKLVAKDPKAKSTNTSSDTDGPTPPKQAS